MSRRSTPLKKTDDPAWPVRIRFLVPDGGLSTITRGGSERPIDDWLHEKFGSAEYAIHPSASSLGHAVAVYFRCVKDAQTFVAAYPGLALADDTMSSVYSSPHFPFGRQEEPDVCNLYSMTKAQDAIRSLFAGIDDRLGNLAPLPEIYPDYRAPIVRHGPGGLELVMGRWGMPTPPQHLVGKSADRGVTNIRNAGSPHWRRWLGPESRCLVPFTAFSERDPHAKRDVWFALGEDGSLAFFAGIWTPWTSVRKVKVGQTEDELYGFLTTSPNAEVGAIHPKAMPVVLRSPEEWQTWLGAPAAEALRLQRPLPDGSLIVVEAPAATTQAG